MKKLWNEKKSMMVFVLVMSILVWLPLQVARADQWSKTYGGSKFDKASSIQQTPDGKFIVAGSTSSFGTGGQDLWVLKLDFSGNVEWQKAFGGNFDEEASSIYQTSDGGFIVAGSTSSFGAGGQDLWVLKFDGSGNVMWQKTYGGTSDDKASSIYQTTDGGFIVAGSTSSFGAGGKDLWVLKLDGSGNVEWQKTYGGSKDEKASSIQQTTDGGFIVAGGTTSFGAGSQDIWVLKLDGSGKVKWQKTYGNIGDEDANAVLEITEGGYLVAGWTNSYANIKKEAWIFKLDEDGIIQWQRLYGSIGDDIVYSIQETLEGVFIGTGSTTSFGAGKEDGWIFLIDANGSLLWQKTFGESGSDEAFSVQQTLDGGYTVAGLFDSLNNDNKGNAWVSKFDRNGNIPSCEIVRFSYATQSSTIIFGTVTNATVGDTNVSPQTSTASEVKVEATPNILCIVEGPDIAVDPLTIDFGSIVRGSSTSQTITVMNIGSKDLLLEEIEFTGVNELDFGIKKDNCSNQTLKPSFDCTIEVGFSPLTSGKRTTYLLIPSDDSDFSNIYVFLEGEGLDPISLKTPANQTSFSVCSLYNLPSFSWEIEGSFQNYEIQFSKNTTFDPIPVKVKTKDTQVTLKSNVWNQVLKIPGEKGGLVYWRVMGTLTGGWTAFVSEYRSIIIEPTSPIGNQEITPTRKSSLPTLSWENNCNVRFRAWFGKDSQFSKRYIIFYTLKNPLDQGGIFSQVLTSSQWDSIRKLVDDLSGSEIFWKVESWDGINRKETSTTLSFVLED